MKKLTGFGYMKLHDRLRFLQLQRERGKKAGALFRERNLGTGISSKMMIDELRLFAHKLGHTPSIKEIDAASRKEVRCSAHFQQRFGSFNKAMMVAGLLPNQQNNNSNFIPDVPYESKQVLLGSLMGDGALTIKGANACFRENHCWSQKSYLTWKAEQLQCFHPTLREYQQGNRKMLNLRTRNCPYLTKMFRTFYRPYKVVTKETLDEIDALALAVWYMDDGTMHRWGYIRLATHSFGMTGNILIQKWFAIKFGIITKIYHSKRYAVDKGFSLYISRAQSTKLLRIIGKFAHPDFNYKFIQPVRKIRAMGTGLSRAEYSREWKERNYQKYLAIKRKSYHKRKAEKALHPNH